MEQQNSNNQSTQTNQPENNPQQNNSQNQPQKANNQNIRSQSERSRSNNQDRRPSQDGNQNHERNRSNDRNQAGERNQLSKNDRTRGQIDSKYAHKSREQRGSEQAKDSQPIKYQPNQPSSAHSINNNNQSRYTKSPFHNAIHGDSAAKYIKPVRIETVEDIQADLERVEKDIQFEIKQIRAVKLSL